MTTQPTISTETVSKTTAGAAAPIRGSRRRFRPHGSPVGRATAPNFRARLAAAFRSLGVGVDEKTGFGRTKAFYRDGGGEWTYALS